MVHYNECPLCQRKNISLLFVCKDHFISKEKFPLFRCNECGFIFTQDHPDKLHIANYYNSDDYISHSNTSKGITNRLYQAARKFMLKRKAGIVREASGLRTGKLLDIGCGTGHFAGYMKENGWSVQGIEINEEARDFAKTRFGIDVKQPSEISMLQDGAFDCITLWHVLEHFDDPIEYASQIKRLLKPGGKCIFALPNCNSFDAEHYSGYWAAWDVPRHLWHFSPSTFMIFAEKTGFSSGALKNLPLDVFYISAMSEKYKGSNFSLVTGLLKGLWFSARSIKNIRRSSSLIYILNNK